MSATQNDAWKDGPANLWCRVCDRGAEGCEHPLPYERGGDA